MDAAVLQEPVIPDNNRVWFPADAALKLDLLGQGDQIIQKSPTVLFIPAVEAFEVGIGDVQSLAASPWMAAYGWMYTFHLVIAKTMVRTQAQSFFLV